MIPSPDLSNTPDKDLVAWALLGREEGRRGLVERYGPAVFRRINELVRDPDLAEDLMQETFLKAFRSLHHYDPERRFAAWILRIAYTKAIDHLRRKRLDTVPLPLNTPPPETQSALAAPVLGQVERRETKVKARQQALDEAVDRLPPTQRRCVRLRFYEHKTPKEIARLLDMPASTVRSHIHRGLENLEVMIELASLWWLYDSPSDPFYSP